MRKDKLRKELKNAHSIISISFNLWTSLNALSVLGIAAHFINKLGRRCYVVLGLCEVVSEYSGKNIAAVLLNIFKDYRICGNIRYFITNNAELNDMYIKVIL